jgi:hypothetical protein
MNFWFAGYPKAPGFASAPGHFRLSQPGACLPFDARFDLEAT